LSLLDRQATLAQTFKGAPSWSDLSGRGSRKLNSMLTSLDAICVYRTELRLPTRHNST
jgi:hypothetical protein